MAINLIKDDLSSRKIRQGILDLFQDFRTIDLTTKFADDDRGPIEGLQDFVSGIIGGKASSFLFKAAGWLVKTTIGTLSFSFTRAWGWLTNRAIQLWNFDWNQSDAQLRAQNRQARLTLASVWGSAFGSAVGWTAGIALGYGISLSLPVIGTKALATLVTKEALEEGLEEVGAIVGGAIRTTAGVIASNQVRNGYILSRKFLQNAQLAFAGVAFGSPAAEEMALQQSSAYSWGGSKAPVWSFASEVEEKVDRLPPGWRAFVESALDEGVDSFFEAGYIISNSLDAFTAQQKAAEAGNPETGLVLYPDREAPQDRIILSGPQDSVIEQAQAALTNHRIIAAKDVGEIAAVPLFEFISPQTSTRTLNLVFQQYDAPPFTRDGERGKKVMLQISDAKPGISFSDLKVRIKPFQWGGLRATMQLSNGRQFAVYGATKQECDKMLTDMLRFTVAEGVRTVYTDCNTGVQAWQRKEPIRMYPVQAIMNYREPNPLPGRVIESSQKMDLWRDSPLQVDAFR